ncbi:hemerythrin domain-containing protein [Spirillospora sp. NPDC048824]|uniref:hemerythrin domain-containing protein n=1 Tax=Spirillospora sp. NPDC048824 TaxID=3364526 RepID=UPI00371D2B83
MIGQLSQEHWEIGETAGGLRRAIVQGRYGAAATMLDELLARLLPHTATEENGLFAELRAEGSLAEEVERLCAEHDDIHAVLGGIDRADPDWPAVLEALGKLREHIDHEEHGLFPSSIIMLPIAAWDRITPERGVQGVGPAPDAAGPDEASPPAA